MPLNTLLHCVNISASWALINSSMFSYQKFQGKYHFFPSKSASKLIYNLDNFSYNQMSVSSYFFSGTRNISSIPWHDSSQTIQRNLSFEILLSEMYVLAQSIIAIMY